jgi:hypothetical protein
MITVNKNPSIPVVHSLSGLAAYWPPLLPSQKQRLAEVLNAKVSWFQQVHRRLGMRSIIFRETASPFM